MQLIIPGSLPPSSVAADLIAHVQEKCPALVRRLSTLAAKEIDCPPESYGCTPLEYLQLSDNGFTGQDGHTFGAGLGPLRAGIIVGNEAVWIADMSSVSIGRDGATLKPSELLELNHEHAEALYESVTPLWEERGISALPIDLGRWRVWLPGSVRLNSISPAAVSSLEVSDWWPQDDSTTVWRKLLNEIQMIWHSHPVNEQRALKGLEPVNSLWLYGGACGWKPLNKASDSLYLNDLTKSFLVNDWASWIEQLPTLSKQLSLLPEGLDITLVGQRRIVKLSPPQQSWWQRALPRRPQNWTAWWTRPN